MSHSDSQILTTTHDVEDDHHQDGHSGAHSGGHSGALKDYLIGFVLSVILTVIPFAVVMEGEFSRATTLWTVVVMAVVQIWVHLKYFLHLNFVTEDGKASSLSFMFSALIIVMVVGLSVWIIYESNAMMMY